MKFSSQCEKSPKQLQSGSLPRRAAAASGGGGGGAKVNVFCDFDALAKSFSLVSSFMACRGQNLGFQALCVLGVRIYRSRTLLRALGFWFQECVVLLYRSRQSFGFVADKDLDRVQHHKQLSMPAKRSTWSNFHANTTPGKRKHRYHEQ